MTETQPGIYTGTFDVEAGTHQFKVRKNASWDLSWGAYEADHDRTQNSQTNIEFTVEKAATITVKFDTTGEDLELWPVSYSIDGGDFIYTGKPNDDPQPSKDPSQQPSQDPSQQPSQQTSRTSDTSVVQPSHNIPTGDSANMVILLVIFLVSGAAVAAVVLAKKSGKSE